MEKMQDDIRALLSQIDKEKVNSAMTAPTVVTDPLLTIWWVIIMNSKPATMANSLGA